MVISNYFHALAAGHYAFVDLGCGSGGSIDHCVRRFHRGAGLGFDLDPKDTAEARRAGYDIVEEDVLTVHVPQRSVAFVSAMDFLEHLPDITAAAWVLKQFSPAAREFLFIRHPSFEEMEYLAGLGLKLCWSDWSDHPNIMRLDELVALFEQLDMTEYAIFPRGLITDSSDDQVVPLSAPTDTKVYDPSILERKPLVRFDRPIFAQYDIFVRLRDGLTDADWE
ncbi:MAG: methyltransferase domain-containing protein, partial [Gammaproteobacteria bacterium]